MGSDRLDPAEPDVEAGLPIGYARGAVSVEEARGVFRTCAPDIAEEVCRAALPHVPILCPAEPARTCDMSSRLTWPCA